MADMMSLCGFSATNACSASTETVVPGRTTTHALDTSTTGDETRTATAPDGTVTTLVFSIGLKSSSR